jgi:hypothetical protein
VIERGKASLAAGATTVLLSGADPGAAESVGTKLSDLLKRPGGG